MKYIFEPKDLYNIIAEMDSDIKIVHYMMSSLMAMEAGNNIAWARKYAERDKVTKDDYTPEFENFWKAYPKKIGKGGAFVVWKKGKLDKYLKQMLDALEWQRKQQQWQNNQYVPNPETYLNQRRWEDEPPNMNPLPIDPNNRYLVMNGVWRTRS